MIFENETHLYTNAKCKFFLIIVIMLTFSTLTMNIS